MFTVGTDLIEINRIKKSMENKNFIQKIFGLNEQKEFEKHNYSPASVAGAFAGKEAFSKALGTGIVGFSLCEVEILHRDNGKPYLLLSGKAKELAKGKQFDISITHTDLLALATVISMEE